MQVILQGRSTLPPSINRQPAPHEHTQRTHTGFENTGVFYRRLLDKIGVVPKVFRREEYKAAMAPVLGEKYDPYARCVLGGL